MRATILSAVFIASIALSLPSTAFAQPSQKKGQAMKERCQAEIRNAKCRGNDACMQAARERCKGRKSDLIQKTAELLGF